MFAMSPRWERKVWDACDYFSTGGRSWPEEPELMSAHQSNPEPEARSCIRRMWPLREEFFSSLFTIKAVYFYSILWAALQDSIMFSSLTRILTQINKYSVFASCIRHSRLFQQLTEPETWKPERAEARPCQCHSVFLWEKANIYTS